MLSLTRKTDYALVALAGLAEMEASASAPVSASRLAHVYALPLPMLMNVLKLLHRADLVAAARGATGGYYLKREPAGISVLEVIETIEGPVRLAPCCEGHQQEAAAPQEQSQEPCNCSTQPSCPISRRIQAIHHQIGTLLRRMTLHDLLDDDSSDPRAGVALTVHSAHEYTDEAHAGSISGMDRTGDSRP